MLDPLYLAEKRAERGCSVHGSRQNYPLNSLLMEFVRAKIV